MADSRLAALLSGQPVDFDTADILQKVRAEQLRRELRGPQPPGPMGPDGREVEFPEGTPGEYQYPWSDPKKAALSTMQGLIMSSGMTGGPGGAVTGAVRHGADQIAASPLSRMLAGAGGAGAAAMPTTAGSAEDTLGQMMKQFDALTKQREAAQAAMDRSQAARDLQFKGDKSKNIKPGIGPDHKAAQAEATEGAASIKRMDEEIGKLGKRIEIEQFNRSPAGVLDAETKRNAFEKQKKADEYGKPIREHLPPWAANMVPAIATGVGIAGMAALKGRNNAEYGRALEAFLAAEKTGDMPAMARRQAQLAALEKGTWGETAATVGTALAPAEIRAMEHVIDTGTNDKDSRAYKEAWARLKDPASLAWDVGTTGLSSLLAYGAGSKFAPNRHPDHSMGRVIASENPYGRARELADDLGGAIVAGENLRRLRQSEPGAQALEANPPTPPSLAQVLQQPSPTQLQLPPPSTRGPMTQGELPPPSAVPNRPSDWPSWAGEPPAGMKPPNKNVLWDINTNQWRHRNGRYY